MNQWHTPRMLALRLAGFTQEQAERLITVRERQASAPEPVADQRLLFARWLAQQGIINEGGEPCAAESPSS